MVDSPLLPWKLAALIVALVAAVGGWRWDWDPGEGTPQARGEYFPEVLPERDPARPAVLFAGNSRLLLALSGAGTCNDVLAAAGMTSAQCGQIGGPWLSALELERELARVAAFAPTVLVLQGDLFFPAREVRTGGTIPQRMRGFELQPAVVRAGLRIAEGVGSARVVVFDPPVSEHVGAELGEGWRARRAAALGSLGGPGRTVIPLPESWANRYFLTDGVHFDPLGERELRRWLGEQLALALAD